MQQKTEHRMGRRKWDKLITDFQKKIRSAKRIGPDAREELIAAMAVLTHVIQNTGRGSLVRWPRGQKLVLKAKWVPKE